MSTTWDSLCEALLIAMDCANYPLYLHCNQGRHRTGCVIACLRKIQRWSIEDIITEYKTYAYPKARSGDIELIKAFEPSCVYDYAVANGYLKDQPYMRRMDSGVTNIDMLAEALSSYGPSDDLGVDISGISGISNTSMASNASNASVMSDTDDGLEIGMTVDDTESPEALRACVQDPAVMELSTSTDVNDDIEMAEAAVDVAKASTLHLQNQNGVPQESKADLTDRAEAIMAPVKSTPASFLQVAGAPQVNTEPA
jgi:hypothetical protein